MTLVESFTKPFQEVESEGNFVVSLISEADDTALEGQTNGRARKKRGGLGIHIQG